MSKEAEAAEAMQQAARRVIEIVKRVSGPPATDATLFHAFALAAGICMANAVFPDAPEGAGKTAGLLFAAGFFQGRADRMKREKEGCQGIA